MVKKKKFSFNFNNWDFYINVIQLYDKIAKFMNEPKSKAHQKGI